MSPTKTPVGPDTSHVHRLIEDHFSTRDGELEVSGVGVSELIAEYGSPIFVYDQSVIVKQLNRVRRATHGRADVFYSMKANPSQQILRTLLTEGCGIEIASAGELDQAFATLIRDLEKNKILDKSG